MTSSDVIAIAGSGITILSMAVSIYFAGTARDYSESLRSAKTRIGLLTLVGSLRSSQDPIQQLPETVSDIRGNKPTIAIAKIRTEFDNSLGALEKSGPVSNARNSIISAQQSLDEYEDSINSVLENEDENPIKVSAKRAMRNHVQSAISEITQAAERLED